VGEHTRRGSQQQLDVSVQPPFAHGLQIVRAAQQLLFERLVAVAGK
jgi:hypothetical protein